MKNKLWMIFLFFAVIFSLATTLMFTNVSVENIPFAAIAIFLIFDLVLWGLFAWQLINNIKLKKVMKEGKEYTATFVSCSSNLRVNGVAMYNITYFWTNDMGEHMEGKSLSTYTRFEAEAFRIAKTFKIKASGKDSAIISKPSELIKDQVEDGVMEKSDIICQYCGSVYGKDEKKCPNCGSSRAK